MRTPILDFLKEYKSKAPHRFHMPGHKGAENGFCEELDITEISGADSLFEATGVIFESERCASELFGADSFYSTEGSSLSIRAMLYLATLDAREKGKKALILAARNAHKSFISAAALVDFDIEWINNSQNNSYLSSKLDFDRLSERLSGKEKPTALYLTSPDYLGNCEDIARAAEICHENGVLLLVDNAHGAYLKFLTPSRHPIDLGADMCCDSAHKTLHALTGSAYLHVSRRHKSLSEKAKAAMSLFASTSPSYLILASLDALNASLLNYKSRLREFLPKISHLKERLSAIGYSFIGDEPLKLTLSTKSYGYYGYELGAILEEKNIYTEFSDRDFLVLMLSPDNSDESLNALFDALSAVEKRPEIKENMPIFSAPVSKFSPREACFLPFERIDAGASLGRALALVSVSCPPAVPILMPGEIIDENALFAFEYYGIKEILVLK